MATGGVGRELMKWMQMKMVVLLVLLFLRLFL
jgi:hypothetical protein